MILQEFEKLTEAKVMIIAKAADKTFGISFEHSREPKRAKGEKGPKGSRITTCKVYEVTDSFVHLLGTGTSACCPIDNFVRAQGRKVSLADALKRGKVDKKYREEIWRAYRLATRSVKTFPKPQLPPVSSVSETLRETIQ